MGLLQENWHRTLGPKWRWHCSIHFYGRSGFGSCAICLTGHGPQPYGRSSFGSCSICLTGHGPQPYGRSGFGSCSICPTCHGLQPWLAFTFATSPSISLSYYSHSSHSILSCSSCPSISCLSYPSCSIYAARCSGSHPSITILYRSWGVQPWGVYHSVSTPWSIVCKYIVLNPSSRLARNAISAFDSRPILEAATRAEANQIYVDASMTGRVIWTTDTVLEEWCCPLVIS